MSVYIYVNISYKSAVVLANVYIILTLQMQTFEALGLN